MCSVFEYKFLLILKYSLANMLYLKTFVSLHEAILFTSVLQLEVKDMEKKSGFYYKFQGEEYWAYLKLFSSLSNFDTVKVVKMKAALHITALNISFLTYCIISTWFQTFYKVFCFALCLWVCSLFFWFFFPMEKKSLWLFIPEEYLLGFLLYNVAPLLEYLILF